MVRDRTVRTDEPSLDRVVAALDDEDCRRIVRELTEPMTAEEICETCDLASSTAYRKLELLTEADLLAEGTEIRSDGHHATRYQTDFREVCVALESDRTLSVTVTRPERDAADRLASMWGEVRRQT